MGRGEGEWFKLCTTLSLTERDLLKVMRGGSEQISFMAGSVFKICQCFNTAFLMTPAIGENCVEKQSEEDSSHGFLANKLNALICDATF